MSTRVTWTRESVIEAIRRRRADGLLINYQAAVRDDEKLTGAARRLFGSWNAALAAAGFDPETIKREARQGPKLPRDSWTKEMVIEGIRQAAREGQDLAAHRMQKWNSSLVATGQRLFGSWREALIAAGYAPDLIQRVHEWTNEEILERIRMLAANGADLSDRTASAYDAGFQAAASKRFGSWAAALEAAGVSYDEVRRTAKWSRSKVLEAIREGRRDRVMQYIARDYFPSWSAALRAAGVPADKAERVGNRIRERRLALGLSQTELGWMLGYSHRAISMLELGQWRDPRVSVALKLAKALQCRVEDIFGE
ncbi:MAG: helix-turn-helix domain-containing protein [Betaproteobacteria bacterium]